MLPAEREDSELRLKGAIPALAALLDESCSSASSLTAEERSSFCVMLPSSFREYTVTGSSSSWSIEARTEKERPSEVPLGISASPASGPNQATFTRLYSPH